MERLSIHRMVKLGRFVLVLLFTVQTFSSCMVMMPGHLTQSGHSGFGKRDAVVHVDPVCGEKIDEHSGEISYLYNGQVYYFHSSACKDNFVESPEKYLHSDHHSHNHQNSNLLFGMGGIAMSAMMLIMLL